jgi:hypothetical protein
MRGGGGTANMPHSWREDAFRLVTFLLHFASAIFLAGVALSCSGDVVTRAYTESTTDSTGFPLVMNATCRDPYSQECFYGMAQAYDVRQEGLQWNVFALLAGFEWLSASFALYYLLEYLDTFVPHAWGVGACQVWNLVGIALFMPYAMRITLLQSGLTALSLVGAGVMQFAGDVQSGLAVRRHGGAGEDEELLFYPTERQAEFEWVEDGGRLWQIPKKAAKGVQKAAEEAIPRSHIHVILHYSEYCASASLLYVAVLILFVQDPLTWAVTVGFTGVFLCNLAGIMAHLSKMDQHNKPPSRWYNLDWVNDGNHFKLFMLHSWTGLALALGVIFYLGKEGLTNEGVPVWVRFVLWNLLVTYSLFGILATALYALMGTMHNPETFNRWMGWLDWGLSVLSVAAKLPIAFTVYYGLVMQPGARSC